MRKLRKYFAIVLIVGAVFPLQAFAKEAKPSDPEITSKSNEPENATIYLSRLREIDEMDKSDLTFKEKSELRKEVRSIKRNLSEINGGVYISAGAVIVILLLLILLV